MKRWLMLGLIGAALGLSARGVEENFSKTVRADDFFAAGLGKLSPTELARLDALVRDFKNGTLVAVAKEPAEPAKEKKPDGGLLARAKNLITPAAEADTGAIESRLAGDFTGWNGRPIFTLENGQRWRLAEAGSYYTPPIASPKVKIYPATFGGFWMTIEGVNQRVKVVPLGSN